MLCEPCAICQGKGTGKTARSVAYDILREAKESQHLAGLSEFIGKSVSLQSETAMGQEQYDIILL